MNRFLFLILHSLSIQLVLAQTTEKPYFQQKVDTKIEVTLDDRTHTLRGFVEMTYYNNSEDTLNFLFIHLWPNAYKNPRTAFAQQMIENGKREFYFSPKAAKGYIDSLDFQVDGEVLDWKFYADQVDIAKVSLKKPLLPATSLKVRTPMRIKIPESVSRLGHIDQSYQLTQWYPKPAVYDHEGWHPMPYLDQGEFYSEFGSFEVSITLPKNYYVGATGKLQDTAEQAFIDQRIAYSKTQDFYALSFKKQETPPSAKEFKTIHYKAENVHDFAWFADKRFFILKDQAVLASKKNIDCYAFFTNEEAHLWKDAASYTKRAIEYYSKIVGEYPYAQATAVQSALSAGAGMEYPMITVIGLSGNSKALDNVITHEVGHNWFYGILASNERVDAWMDEGFNSYVEARYMDTYYNTFSRTNYLAYLLQARQRKDQASTTTSEKLTNINYFLGAYSKPSMVFQYLETYLGRAEMDRILQQYYIQWKFKHPRPIDVQNVFEKESGKQLDWVFKDLLGSTKQLDYGFTQGKIQGKQIELKVRNKGEIVAPFEIAAVNKEDKVLDRFWFIGLPAGKDTLLNLPLSSNTHAYRIDASRKMPDIDRTDNFYRPKALKKIGIAPALTFLLNPQFPEYPAINFIPVVGGNTHDGVLLGLGIYNLPIPARTWEYSMIPMFGTKSKTIAAIAEVRRNSFPKSGFLDKWSVGIGLKSFQAFDNDNFDYQLRYTRLNPNLVVNFRKKTARAYTRHQLRLDNLIFLEEDEIFSVSGGRVSFDGKAQKWRSTHRLGHLYQYKHPIYPFRINSQLEYANYPNQNTYEHYTKLTVEGNFKFYFAKQWAADIRIFTGGFPTHSDRDFGDFPLHLAARNNNDYHYDEMIWGRGAMGGGLADQQVSLREGGFKTPIDIAQVLADGSSNSFIIAMNIKTNIPVRLPFRIPFVALKPYVDIGYFKNTAPAVAITSVSDEIFMNGGFMIDIWDGAAGIYFPLFSTSNLNTFMQQRGGYWNQIGLSLKLQKLHPKNIADKLLNTF